MSGAILFNAFGTALNVALFVAYGDWWSLAAAIFCGLLFIATVLLLWDLA